MELALTTRQRAARLALRLLRPVRSFLVALRSLLHWVSRVEVHDVFLLGGMGLLAFGLWQIWKPLPYVVIGALLIRLAVGPLVMPASPIPQEKRKRHGAR